MAKSIKIGSVRVGGKAPLALFAGPCVIESRQGCMDLASRLVKLAKAENIPLIFKASYDKANRSSVKSYRGPGLEAGLAILQEIKDKYNVPVVTDVHSVEEVRAAAKVVDVLQIPAFLSRQTDLLVAAGETGRVVNVKKGQFMAPWDMKNVIDKVEATGNSKIMLTERGASFGYNNLVADMRSILAMSEYGYPVIFDATHSVQKPGGSGTSSSGDGKWAPSLARAAVATGCSAVFIETHVNPDEALSDKDNAIAFKAMKPLWRTLVKINDLVK